MLLYDHSYNKKVNTYRPYKPNLNQSCWDMQSFRLLPKIMFFPIDIAEKNSAIVVNKRDLAGK